MTDNLFRLTQNFILLQISNLSALTSSKFQTTAVDNIKMKTSEISLGKAALLAGIGYIMMMGTPFAEFYAMPKLIVTGNGATILKSLIDQRFFLRVAITGYVINFAGDILAAWALYILLKPVNKSLSLLACWLRIIYTLVSLSALLNLVTILSITKAPGQYDASFLNNQVVALLSAFYNGWALAYLFFGTYLCLLGWLIFRSGYMPGWIGAYVFIAGLGWLADNLQPLLYPGFNINFIFVSIAGLGELVLMVWLLVKGVKLKNFTHELVM